MFWKCFLALEGKGEDDGTEETRSRLGERRRRACATYGTERVRVQEAALLHTNVENALNYCPHAGVRAQQVTS